MFSFIHSYVRSFRYTPDVTPLSNISVPLLSIVCYLGTMKFIQMYIPKKYKPLDLTRFVIIYNAIMSVASGILLILLVSRLNEMFQQFSFWNTLCVPEPLFYSGNAHIGPQQAYYYINYIFKYIELTDTILLALRGKPIPFIHYYHHAITLFLTWTQLNAQTCLQWVVITLNLTVHVFLYAYYSLQAAKMDVWWKRYLTVLQIIQFIIALTVSVTVMSARLLYEMGTSYGDACTGSWFASWFGMFVLFSFLFLFIQLYYERYPQPTKPRSKQEKSAIGNDEEEETGIIFMTDESHIKKEGINPHKMEGKKTM